MNDEKYLYKVGGNFHGIIPTSVMLGIFGGIGIWLYKSGNGAFIFFAFFTAVLLIMLLSVFYRKLFIKVLVYDDGFYYQTRPGNGKKYRYSDIKKAWVSSGKDIGGSNQEFCNFTSCDGETVRFPFLPYESEGVDYIVERVENRISCKYENEIEENAIYRIDGKKYGIASMIISAIVFLFFFAVEGSLFAWQLKTNGWIMVYFLGVSILLTLSMPVKALFNYFYYKIIIERDGFYVRTNPFNGKHFDYTEITAYKEIFKVVRHRNIDGPNRRTYHYFFLFKDITGKTHYFLFTKYLYEHEINILKERIARANNNEISDDVDLKAPKAAKLIGRISQTLFFLILSAIMVYCAYFYITEKVVPNRTVDSNISITENKITVPDQETVLKLLNKKGFETSNIPVTYWFVGEDDLQFVAAGVKDDMKFEFYDYGNSDTVDLCFNEISYKISMDMEPRDRDELIKDTPGGKIFTFTENSITSTVIYKKNTIVYVSYPDSSIEIPEILQCLGYVL